MLLFLILVPEDQEASTKNILFLKQETSHAILRVTIAERALNFDVGVWIKRHCSVQIIIIFGFCAD